jgi:outer membrane lipoprotein-sorting protein
MTPQEATGKFKESETLYAQGQYDQALQVLKELDAAYPNQKNILYPMALCHASLGSNEEAAEVCDRLVNEFQDGRAQSLRDQLQPSTLQADGLALDMDLLGDIAQPVKKRQSRPAQQPSRMPLYAGIGGAVALIAIIAILIGTGALGGILAKLKPETVESAFDKIAAAAAKVNACSGKFEVNAQLSQPIPLKINCLGDFDFAYAEEKPMYRINANVGVEGPETANQSMTLVCDGDNAYNEMNIMGKTMVMKVGTQSTAQMEPKQMLAELKKAGTATLEKDEVVDNKPAYVFLIKMKEGGASTPPGFPQVGDMKVAVAKETGLPMRMEAKDKAGAPLFSAALKEVIVNMPSSPDKFKYTPPANVPVMSMEDLQKMMPVPGMPGMR